MILNMKSAVELIGIQTEILTPVPCLSQWNRAKRKVFHSLKHHKIKSFSILKAKQLLVHTRNIFHLYRFPVQLQVQSHHWILLCKLYVQMNNGLVNLSSWLHYYIFCSDTKCFWIHILHYDLWCTVIEIKESPSINSGISEKSDNYLMYSSLQINESKV